MRPGAARVLRVCELIQSERSSVDAALSRLPPSIRGYVHELSAGVLVTLESARSGWQFAPRVLVLRRLHRHLAEVVAASSRVMVVGAVIRREDRVLAAQRAHPPALAGFWEFPGGKVEHGENIELALVRECQEELGALIEVGPELGRTTLPSGALLVLCWAGLAEPGAEPQCREHAELRWCDRTELASLAWLDSNRRFATQIAALGNRPGASGDLRPTVEGPDSAG